MTKLAAWWRRLTHRHNDSCAHDIALMGFGSATECMNCGVGYGWSTWCVAVCDVAMDEWNRTKR